jgi:hypothetical protein
MFATLAAALAILGGCNRPLSDPKLLKAIHFEAETLMRSYRPEHMNERKNVSKGEWPAVIAGLRPENVMVHSSGVEIVTKSGFDGGYGYEVPRTKAGLSMPAACYSELSPGVFWHDPC